MKLSKIKLFLSTIIAMGIIIVPGVSFSENEIQIQESEISVSLSPQNPEPYENVTINISSYATDLNKANIIWVVGGGTVLSGIGKTSYTIKAGGPDSSTAISINVTPSGTINTIVKKIVVYPSEIEIMWESVDGYTPPFYKGKSLPVSGSLIKAVAIPNTRTIKSGNGSITYTWKNADSVVSDASGYNKNSYIFKNSVFDKTNQITVQASSVDNSYQAEKIINIPIYDPKLIFYKKSPTEGILYEKALQNGINITEDEMTIVAEPYFLTTNNNNAEFSYTWKINGNNVATPSKKTEMTIRPTSRGGYATISLIIKNLNELFQEVTNNLKINII